MNDQAFKLLMDRLSQIEEKLDDINAWRWKIEGARLFVVFVLTVGVSIATAKLSR